MKSCIRPLALVSTSLLLINWGSGDTNVDGRAKPTINFYGTIQDNTAAIFTAENITIGGQFRQISVHPLPQLDIKNADYDPTINTALLDFAEIATIQVPNPHTTYTFKGRNYIMIQVVSNDQAETTNNYIIELTKKVFCDQMNGAGPLERELKFIAVEKISFEGYKDQAPVAAPAPKKYKALMVPSQPRATKSA